MARSLSQLREENEYLMNKLFIANDSFRRIQDILNENLEQPILNRHVNRPKPTAKRKAEPIKENPQPKQIKGMNANSQAVVAEKLVEGPQHTSKIAFTNNKALDSSHSPTDVWEALERTNRPQYRIRFIKPKKQSSKKPSPKKQSPKKPSPKKQSSPKNQSENRKQSSHGKNITAIPISNQRNTKKVMSEPTRLSLPRKAAPTKLHDISWKNFSSFCKDTTK